jgi:hypothetical protein
MKGWLVQRAYRSGRGLPEEVGAAMTSSDHRADSDADDETRELVLGVIAAPGPATELASSLLPELPKRLAGRVPKVLARLGRHVEEDHHRIRPFANVITGNFRLLLVRPVGAGEEHHHDPGPSRVVNVQIYEVLEPPHS